MDPIIRMIIRKVTQKLIKTGYQAYKNVSNKHMPLQENMFNQMKSHLNLTTKQNLSVVEAHKILNLDSDLKHSEETINKVF